MLSNELIEKFQIFSSYPNASILELAVLLKSNRKMVLTDIRKINDILFSVGLPRIQIEESYIQMPDISLNDLFSRMSLDSGEYLFFEERLDMIILYILLNTDFVSNTHLQCLLQMSKNSVLSDLKKARLQAKKYGGQLVYTRQEGYIIRATDTKRMLLLEQVVENILAKASGSWVIKYVLDECQLQINIEEIYNFLYDLGCQYHLVFIFEKTKAVSYLLAVLASQQWEEQTVIGPPYLSKMEQSSIGRLVKELVVSYPLLEQKRYFIMSRLAGCIQGDLIDNPDPLMIFIMDRIINQVKAYTGIEFRDSIQFRKDLYAHLYPAFYRLLFDIPLNNPLKEQILKDFNSLFHLVRRSLSPLEKYLKKTISNDEIAYFTIHFGGYLEQIGTSNQSAKLTALTICPNGVSSSLILQSELKQLFPKMVFREVHQLKQVKEIGVSTYDMIFSTIYFETNKPLYLLKPLMNSMEKIMLKKQVCTDFNIDEMGISVEELLQIIHRHAEIKDMSKLRRELSTYIMGNQEKQELGGYGLVDLLERKLIRQIECVPDWKKAIQVASAPLLEQGYIHQSYVEGMIDSVEQMGPYIVLAPRVAVPHASPEYGVDKLGISLLQLKQPVDFDITDEGDEEKQVQLIFVLAAVDSTSHLKSLQELAMILDDEEVVGSLIRAETIDEILCIITEAIEKGESYD